MLWNFEVERNLDLHCPFKKKRGTVEEIIFNQKNVFYISYFGIAATRISVGIPVDTWISRNLGPTTKLSGSVLQYVAYDYQSSATYTSLNEKF